MSNLQSMILAVGACVTVIISASLIANAIESQNVPGVSDAGRWTVQQTASDGWIVMDTATGKLCVIPNAQNADQTIHCTNEPRR